MVREEESAELTTARLKAISDLLGQSGIGEDRIITEQVESIESSKRGRVEMRLIE